ncbi:GNAT family N-acetyltransferase [Dactylosporangium sp. NBC_01737]|uniref:GNAT family N-acetyltransferase n=1 Tax=Dactylosporangium sp. NBC_01737 TaxID=2975959 RepID=UPI002E0D72E5|nr:GNAT family N-acetyltransferase [Dactylosporangium sp. NBC_01737]
MRLRRWTEDDVEAFYDIYSRWEVMRHLGAHPRRVIPDREEALARLGRMRGREDGPRGYWAIEVDGVPVGTVLLLPLEGDDGEVEIGWHLHPAHHGKGLATRAARELLSRTGGRVLALTDEDNLASQAVATRLGMTDEGLTDRWYGITARQFAITLD